MKRIFRWRDSKAADGVVLPRSVQERDREWSRDEEAVMETWVVGRREFKRE
jgi:hypothetical protein